jgi:para-nitrobenzyl esterase
MYYFRMTGPLLFVAVFARGQAPVVKTAEGYLRGLTENGIQVFKGIPYARPPVGDARFLPPVAHAPWKDTLSATAFGARSIQPVGNKAMGSEDCLYLNVYTPATDRGQRPVVVWVHGGGMTNGSGSGMNGHAFADHDGIVAVTINYRLGALGFLYLGDLGQRYASSGNLGLLDVVAALTWIHRNIAAFGGDPDKVTVMGESAGAKLLSAVMVSPSSKGLFRQSILESGSVQCIRDTLTARNERSRLLHQLGLWDARQLLDIPADTLIRAQGRICEGIGGNSQFGPVYDGVTIKDDAYRVAPTLSGIRVLMGTNEDEGAAFVSPTTQDYTAIFAPLFQSNAPMARAYYERQLTTDAPYPALVKTLTQYMYQIHTYRFAHQLCVAGIPVWMYRYRFRKGVPLGARHGNELHYIWAADRIAASDAGPAEKQLALHLHTAWVNFIKMGTPLPDWPRYDPGTRKVMVFDTTDEVTALKEVYDDPALPSAVFVLH